MMTIQPYWHPPTNSWVFDDKEKDIIQEPFINGIPAMIDNLVKNIPQAKNGFQITFSHQPFPDYQVKITRTRKESGGWWYTNKTTKQEGWLCQALFSYFPKAPKEIYLKAESLI